MPTQTTAHLSAGHILTVTADSGSYGSVRRVINDLAKQSVYPIASNSSVDVGPFSADRQFEIISDSGQLTYSISQDDEEISPSRLWDAVTTFLEGQIVIDRGGLWQAVASNTNSRPICGNTDWLLVGGVPYVDVNLDPVQLTTMPFYDPNEAGDGVPICGPPGEGNIVYPVYVSNFSTSGDNWAQRAYARIAWAPGFWAASGLAQGNITDVLDGQNFPEAFMQGDPSADEKNLEWIDVPADDSTINKGLAIATSNDVTNGGAAFGTKSINYRVFYQIRRASDADFAKFFRVTALNQGGKKFTVNSDATALTGSIAVVGSTGNNGSYTITGSIYLNQPQAITAVNQGTKTFTVSGDQRQLYPVGATATVAGSTGNDGAYTIVSATLTSGNTAIVVAEAIPNATADGTITGPNATVIAVSEAIPSSTADGWVKK